MNGKLSRHDASSHKDMARMLPEEEDLMSFMDDDAWNVHGVSQEQSRVDTMTEANWMEVINAHSKPPDYATRRESDGSGSMIPSARMAQFFRNGNGIFDKGVQYLVARAFKRVNHTSQTNYHPHDVMQMMRLALLFHRGTPDTQSLLVDFLNGIKNHPSIDYNVYTNVDLPTSLKELRPIFFEGKYAIAPNMPMPKGISMFGHVYYSLFGVVAYLLMMGFPIEPLVDIPQQEAVTRILESSRARTIRENMRQANAGANRLTIGVIPWSDDCDPFNLLNKNSVWVLANTFAIPHARLQTSDNTMLIALGKKAPDHRVIWEKWCEEFKLLSNPSNDYWFYFAPLQRNVRVCLQLLAVEQDCPERRSQLGMAGSNGLTAARWRYAANASQTSSRLPSCEACMDRRVSGNTSGMDTECESGVCADWNMKTTSNLLDYAPPSSYPECMLNIEGENGMFGPRELDFSVLTSVMDIAMEGYEDGEFTKTGATAILKDCGISQQECDRAMLAVDRDERDVFQYNPLWCLGVSLVLFMDLIMHLLFLGVVKRVIKHMIRVWLSLQKVHSVFCRNFGSVTRKVGALHLWWCKPRDYGEGKFGGWISDTYLAHARLLRWEYSMLSELASEEYVEPEAGQRWLKTDYVDWLRAHGQPTTGKKAEVMARVANLKTQPGGPPPLASVCGGPVENVTNVIISLVAVLSILMVAAVTPDICVEMDRQIKIFLSLCLRLDECIRGTGEDPFFVGKNNFLSMLNLPNLAMIYGPLRLFWDGSGKCEGFLRTLKPLIKGLQKGWALCVGERFYLDKTFKWMFGAEPAHSESTTYYQYSTEDALESAFACGDVMAGVVMKSIVDPIENEAIFLVSKTKVWQVEVDGDPSSTILGANYFAMKVVSKLGRHDWDLLCNGYGIVRECLLLPKLHFSGRFAHVVPESADFGRATYYIIGSDWKEVNRHGEFQLPLYPLI